MEDFLLGLLNLATLGLALYIGGWVMFISPLITLSSSTAITGGMVVGTILKVLFALPLALFVRGILNYIFVKIIMTIC